MINSGRVYFISAVAAAAALIAVIVLLSVQIGGLKTRISDSEDQYRRQLEDNRMQLDRFSQNLQILASGGNEVRRYMDLPEKELIRETAAESGETADPAVLFFDAFRFLVSQELEEKRAAEYSLWLDEHDIEEFFSAQGYLLQRDDHSRSSVREGGEILLSLSYDSEGKSIEFSHVGGTVFTLSSDNEHPEKELEKSIGILNSHNRAVEDTTRYIRGIADEASFFEILNRRGLILADGENGGFDILNVKDESLLGTIRQKGIAIKLNGDIFEGREDFASALAGFLESVSTETERERVDNLVLQTMEEVFADEGFKVLLESENCLPEPVRREDEEFIYFDIYRGDGTVRGTYALQKDFGEVLLISGDGKYLKSLNMFAPGNDFRSLIMEAESRKRSQSPYAFDDSSETFLVVGTHERNADTMIIVHANNKTGKVKMISFPRDLYYKGNKINNIYKEYGPEQLCAELSEITGLSIKKYISIDMFAFIDVINILGGIDVTLKQDLIDPTYKVKNNGVWSTLHYRKGTHHLDGVSALRVARSRHGSEAYDRSRRQQLIITAVLNKMKSLNAGDISTLYEFVTSVFSYIDTNLTIADLVKNFMMYKDNEIEDPNTINTDNILDAEWTNTYLLPEEEKEKALADENFFRGQWIVLPKNNDWDLFRKYLESILISGN